MYNDRNQYSVDKLKCVGLSISLTLCCNLVATADVIKFSSTLHKIPAVFRLLN